MNKQKIINATRISLAVTLVSLSLLGATAFAMGPHGWQGGKHHGQGGQGQEMMTKNVDRKVENIANGIQMTLTSTDAATVTKLQARKAPPAKDSTTTVTQTNIANGIQITITSTDAAEVKKIQDRKGHLDGPGHGPEFDFSKVQKKVDNTANGATITLTSDDAATVKMIQDLAQHFGQHPGPEGDDEAGETQQ